MTLYFGGVSALRRRAAPVIVLSYYSLYKLKAAPYSQVIGSKNRVILFWEESELASEKCF